MSDMQASLPGGERHAAVGTEYLQSVATMVRIWQPPGPLLASIHAAAHALASPMIRQLHTVTAVKAQRVPFTWRFKLKLWHLHDAGYVEK